LARGAPPAGVYTLDPPAAVGRLLARARDGDADAVAELGGRPDAAPYLRLALKPPADLLPGARALADALEAAESRAAERNRKRYAGWVRDGRLDLCAEVLVACPDKKDAAELADLTVPLRTRIAARFAEDADPRPGRQAWYRNLFAHPRFAAIPADEHHAGDRVALGRPVSPGPGGVFVRADRCTAERATRGGFVAVRTELSTPPEVRYNTTVTSEWFMSVVLVNSDHRLAKPDESLVVCDGDIELTTYTWRSVVIANGTIRAGVFGGPVDSFLAATGDIVLPRRKRAENSVFHAGGAVTLADKPDAADRDRIREHQSRLPFGIQFFDPAELGLTLDAQKDGVRVRELAPHSPLARYGVAAGDVIAAVGDVRTATLADARRQLRRGVVAESAVLRVRRGETALTRIVFFDGIPTPPAPPAPAPHEPKPSE
jgi:hypothetical protein